MSSVESGSHGSGPGPGARWQHSAGGTSGSPQHGSKGTTGTSRRDFSHGGGIHTADDDDEGVEPSYHEDDLVAYHRQQQDLAAQEGHSPTAAQGHGGGMVKSSSCPGPGDYMWSDNVHLRQKPSWTMSSPDRKNKDMMLGTWTPASFSLQPRAPDPCAYSVDGLGRNGKFQAAKWSFSQGRKPRPCMEPPPPDKIEMHLRQYTALGGDHPTIRKVPQFSLSGAERKNLAPGTNSWTPSSNSDMRPGPGAYDTHRVPRWKAVPRKGTFGSRPKNLHPEVKGWVPTSRDSRAGGGEAARLGMSAPSLKPMFHPGIFRGR